MNMLLLFDISHRVSGSSGAGCAFAHPIFCSFINRGLSFGHKTWTFMLIYTPNVSRLPLTLAQTKLSIVLNTLLKFNFGLF